MILVGIDTGVATGLAVYDTATRRLLRVTSSGIIAAMDAVQALAAEQGCTVFLEDARLRKWIPREKSLSQFRGRAMGAGSVKRDASVWEEFLTARGIPFHLVPPSRNRTKLTAGAFATLTGWTQRTNDHGRDAAMLVFGR